MAQTDYAHGSDKAFRIVFPVMFIGFGVGATYCWMNGHTVNGVVCTLFALLAIGGFTTALRLRGFRDVASAAVLAHFKEKGAEKVADIGTGKGRLAVDLAKDGLTVVGEDISERDLDVARENATAEQVDVEFVLGTTTSIGLPESAFDGVTSLQLLHEVKDRDALLAEVHGILREDGHFAMVDFRRGPGLFTLMWFAMFRALTAGALQKQLTGAGFRNVSVTAISLVHQLITAEKE